MLVFPNSPFKQSAYLLASFVSEREITTEMDGLPCVMQVRIILEVTPFIVTFVS
jgi:hypothetical protein